MQSKLRANFALQIANFKTTAWAQFAEQIAQHRQLFLSLHDK